MKYLIPICLLFLFSCEERKKIPVSAPKADEATILDSILTALSANDFDTTVAGKRQFQLYKLYYKSVSDWGGFNYFTVIRVRTNSSEKVVCTKGNFLLGALEMEGYNANDIYKNKDRTFRIVSDSALNNINYYEYSAREKARVAKKYNFESLLKRLKEGDISVEIENDDHTEMTILAHLFFEEGYLSGESSCSGGSLEVFTDEIRMED